MHRIDNENQLKNAPKGVWVDSRGYTWETEELDTLDFPYERLFTLREAVFYLAGWATDKEAFAGTFSSGLDVGVISPEEAITIGVMGMMGESNQEIIDALK